MQKSGAKAYLVNTGWNGTGKRISIKDTRGIIDAILGGAILNAPTKTIPYFGLEVPTELEGVDTGILDPRDTYADPAEWDEKARDLASPLHQELRQVHQQRGRQGPWSPPVPRWTEHLSADAAVSRRTAVLGSSL